MNFQSFFVFSDRWKAVFTHKPHYSKSPFLEILHENREKNSLFSRFSSYLIIYKLLPY